VYCPINSSTKSFEFGKDGVGGGGPHKRLRMGIVVGDELIDLAHQVGKGLERITADGALRDEAEPAPSLLSISGIAVTDAPRVRSIGLLGVENFSAW
jgi:hypothetical protein